MSKNKSCKRCSAKLKHGVLLPSHLLCTQTDTLSEKVEAELKQSDPELQTAELAIAQATNCKGVNGEEDKDENVDSDSY